MDYLGYFSREALLEWVEKEFPFVPKPRDNQLMYFDDSDCVSRYIKEHMQQFSQAKLPRDGVRYLHDELGNLSAYGIQWLMPSLLRAILRCEDKYDSLMDCLIYDLEGYDKRAENICERYRLFTQSQFECLAAILEFISEQSGYSITEALETIERLNG